MGFYSFIVVSPDVIQLPEYVICLDHGRNVFNATVNDLDRFKARMSELNVEILQVNRLDEYEPPPSYDEICQQAPFADELPAAHTVRVALPEWSK